MKVKFFIAIFFALYIKIDIYAQVCGQIYTFNHISGTIAPVNKTVNYSTIWSNISGSNKCWITQNLGSNNQAILATDNTELSAGWYWQFNRSRGYKHDGVLRTPNTWTTTSINENSNWLPANDPCLQLLSGTWRIPTFTEWTNVQTSSNWINYNSSFASILKIHAAGFLSYSMGSLILRGNSGMYWSNSQYDNNSGNNLYISNSFSYICYSDKAYGATLRCISDECTPTSSNAGVDTNICGNSCVLYANNPLLGVGSWRIISGVGGVIADSNSINSQFTGTAGNTYLLSWIISNPPCTASVDTIRISFIANPSISNAGNDTIICGNSCELFANNPVIGAGQWNIVSGNGGMIANTSSGNSQFNGIAGNNYSLRWTISNLPCTATFDTVRVSFRTNPTVAVAGNDTNVCGNNYIMSANNPINGTGSWSIVSGIGGYFSDTSTFNSNFNGITGNTYNLQWEISNNPCGITTDNVFVTFVQPPVQANAGSDTVVFSNDTSIYLYANSPLLNNGYWRIITGNGGAFNDSTLFNTQFTGNSNTTYYLVWTIYNQYCPPTADTIMVRFTQCGNSFLVNHVAGAIAPVNKNVTYGTVLTNLSGSYKCWITQNLGADNQAVSATDSTEQAAGWYWQFNRPQGYKHDGTNRTPNTPWITTDPVAGDWLISNDPCNFLLGSSWRLPTYSELNSVDINGVWNNFYDSYNSVLKIHSSERLEYTNGSFYDNANGHYWTSTQMDATFGRNLYLRSNIANMNVSNKTFGYTIRCIRD